MKQLVFVAKETASGDQFVADDDGYLCFLRPELSGALLHWKWSIESGGGWTHRGDPEQITVHAEGHSVSPIKAECEMLAWLKAQAHSEN